MTLDTRCLLVDDHTLFSEALALLIAHRHPEVALRTAASLGQALQRLADEDMHLVLLDLNLPDSRGVDTLRRLREAAPTVRSIVLSADDRAETVEAALEAGAAGFISKTADGDTLGGALRKVLAGGVYVPTALLGAAPSHAGPELELPQLTPRQLDVFRGVVDGKSNKLIARELGLSDATVKPHVQAIYERLGIGSRAQAVLVAARQGWLRPG
jgi:two-component system nitrate/nitrite response regulator NarL